MFTQMKRNAYLAKCGIKILKNTDQPAFSWNGAIFNVPNTAEGNLRIWLRREDQSKVTQDQIIYLQGWLKSLDYSGHHTNLNLIQEMSWRG